MRLKGKKTTHFGWHVGELKAPIMNGFGYLVSMTTQTKANPNQRYTNQVKEPAKAATRRIKRRPWNTPNI